MAAQPLRELQIPEDEDRSFSRPVQDGEIGYTAGTEKISIIPMNKFMQNLKRVTQGDVISTTNLKTDHRSSVGALDFGTASIRGDTRTLFWKAAKNLVTFRAELNGIRCITSFFPPDRLLLPIAVDIERRFIFYEYLPYRTLWDRRLDYAVRLAKGDPADAQKLADLRALIHSVEKRKSFDMRATYKLSIEHLLHNRPADEDVNTSVLITVYIHGRALQATSMLSKTWPDGISLGTGGERPELSVAQLLSYKFVINDRSYPSIDNRLDIVRAELSPGMFDGCVLAASLGDDRATNALLSGPEAGDRLVYVDYEAAGLQNALVGVLWGLHLDCFFGAVEVDTLAERLGIPKMSDAERDFALGVDVDHHRQTISVRHNYWDCHGPPGWDEVDQLTFYWRYRNVLLPVVRLAEERGLKLCPGGTERWREVVGKVFFAGGVMRINPYRNVERLLLNICVGMELWDFGQWLEEVWSPVERSLIDEKSEQLVGEE